MLSLLLSVLTLTIELEELVEPSPGPLWIEESIELPLLHESSITSSITDRMSTMTNVLSSLVQKDEYTKLLEEKNGMLTNENFALKTCLTHMIALIRSTDENTANIAVMSVLILSCLLSFVCCMRYSQKIASSPVLVSAEPIVVASDITKPET